MVEVTPRTLLQRGTDPISIVEEAVGPRAGLGVCGNSCPQPRFDPRTVQPVESRCIYCAAPNIHDDDDDDDDDDGVDDDNV